MALVYSTEHGKMCPACEKPLSACACRKGAARGGDGIVRVGRETQGRKGKGVTVITGIPLPDDALEKLAGELKRLCGSGGACRDGVIEIQGEHRDALVACLQKKGYTVKRSGG